MGLIDLKPVIAKLDETNAQLAQTNEKLDLVIALLTRQNEEIIKRNAAVLTRSK
ncbi:MAG: hypothetical protein AAB375_03675 [Patescibacteria group bacterium]